MARPRSPGPVYMLPPTVGYNKHDATRYRNPQYSISPKLTGVGSKGPSPGPQYQIGGLTQHGKLNVPAYSIKSRPKNLTPFLVPGPGAYSPERVPRMKEQRPPAYTIQGRSKYAVAGLGPGPAYNLPSMLGPKVPNKHAAGAYTIAGRHDLRRAQESPGPANYKGISSNIYKNKQPAYTIAGRMDKGGPRNISPGPAAYLPNKLCGEKGPMFSMRSRYADIFIPYITAEDNMPCANR